MFFRSVQDDEHETGHSKYFYFDLSLAFLIFDPVFLCFLNLFYEPMNRKGHLCILALLFIIVDNLIQLQLNKDYRIT